MHACMHTYIYVDMYTYAYYRLIVYTYSCLRVVPILGTLEPKYILVGYMDPYSLRVKVYGFRV